MSNHVFITAKTKVTVFGVDENVVGYLLIRPHPRLVSYWSQNVVILSDPSLPFDLRIRRTPLTSFLSILLFYLNRVNPNLCRKISIYFGRPVNGITGSRGLDEK